MLRYVRRGAGSSAKMCSSAIAVLQVFHRGALHVTQERLAPDEAITDSLVQLQRLNKKGENKRGKARARQADCQGKDKETQTSWSMLYVDDASIVSRSPNGLERMTTVTVSACAAFLLTVAAAKTEIM